MGVGLTVVAIALGWYGGVALLFAAEPVRARFESVRNTLDRFAGGIIGVFGATLIGRELIGGSR